MKVKFSVILDRIENNYAKTIIKDSFCHTPQGFKEARKLVPPFFKIPGFTSPKKVPFQHCFKLSQEVIDSKYYMEPKMSRLIVKLWAEKNKEIVELVQSKLLERGYKAKAPNFDLIHLEIDSLQEPDIYNDENDCAFFRPDGNKIENHPDEAVTMAAAILGYFPLSEEGIRKCDDGTEKELIEAENAQTNDTETEKLDNNKPNEPVEIEQSSDEPETTPHPIDPSLGVEMIIQTSTPTENILDQLEKMFKDESIFYKNLAENLNNGILPNLSTINERLLKINQLLTKFASEVNFTKELSFDAFSALKTFYESEKQRIGKSIKDQQFIAGLLSKISAVKHKKNQNLPLISSIKQLAENYQELLDAPESHQMDWFKLMIIEKHFLNILVQCIEFRHTPDHDDEILDAMLIDLKNAARIEQLDFYDILETQINRGNLVFVDIPVTPDDKKVQIEAETKPEATTEVETSATDTLVSKEETPDTKPENVEAVPAEYNTVKPEIEVQTKTSHRVESPQQNEKVEPVVTTQEDAASKQTEQEHKPSRPKKTTITHEISDHDSKLLELLKHNEPELAYHLSKCYEALGIEPLLPSFLIENLVLTPYIQSDTGPIAQRMEPNIYKYEFNFDKSEKNQFINQLFFASILRPCFFAYDTIGAGSVLQEIHSGKMAEFSGIKKLIGDLMSQKGNTLSFERIKQLKGKEETQERKKEFIDKLTDWLEKAQLARYRNKPNHFHSLLFNNWVKPDGWIHTTVNAFISKKDCKKLEVFLENDLNDASWNKRYKKELKLIASNLKSALDNTEAARWFGNNIEELQVLLESGLALFANDEKSYNEQDDEATLTFIEKLLEEFTRVETLLAGVSNENIFNEVAYRYISSAFRNVEELLNGQSSAVKLLPVDTILNWPLLKLDYYDSDENWLPAEYGQSLASHITSIIPSLPLETSALEQKHLKSGNFEALHRLISLNMISAGNPELHKTFGSFNDRLVSLVNKLKVEIERGCAFGYIQNGGRESLIAKIETIRVHNNLEASSLNYPLKKAMLEEVHAAIQDLKAHIKEECMTKLLPKVDKEYHDYLKRVLEKGNIFVFNDVVERLKTGKLVLPEEEGLVLEDFYKNFLATENGHDMTKIISAVTSRKSSQGLDFSKITDFQSADAEKNINIWQSLKSKEITSEPEGFGLIHPLLEMLGLSSAKLDLSARFKKATYFDFSCTPMAGRTKTPLPQYGSFAQGKYRIVTFTSKLTEEDLVETVKDLIPQTNRAVIVFCFFWMDQRYRLELAKLNRKGRITALALDDAMLVYLLSLKESKFPSFVKLAAPFTFAEPYQTASSNLPEEMFYGRKPQIQKLKNIIGDFSCLIYGGRQLGKTVLQREVERIFNEPEKKYYAIYFDLRNSGLGSWRPISDLAEVLIESFGHIPGLIPEKRSQNARLQYLIDKIKDWLDANPEGRIILFLDESDKFLDKDSQSEWQHVLPLKGLMEKTEKRFKVVFAGLHDVRRTMKIPNNPLAHFGNPICVGPMLDNEEAREAQLLITLPLQTIGAKFESDDLIFSILSHCNWYPSLIQIFCKTLVNLINEKRQINTLPMIITPNDVSQAYERSRDEIKEKFNLTLSLDERYNLIANIIASESINNYEVLSKGMSVEKITDSALLYWPEGFDKTNPKVEVKFLLEEMADLGILRFEPDGNAALRTPNLLGFIGDEKQVKDNLDYKERTLPSEFNRETSRIIYNSDNRELRSPFPALYYDKMIDPDNKIIIIRGSAMGGINAIVEFLKSRKKELNLIKPNPPFMDDEDYWKAIEKKRMSNRHNLILFDEKNENIFEDITAISKWLENKTAISALFMIRPENLWSIFSKNDNVFQKLENQRADIFNIPQWNIEVAREWFRETGCITADVNEIFSKIGNWDKLLREYHNRIVTSPETWLEKLNAYKQSFASKKENMLGDFGLFNDDIIDAVKFLIEWDGSLSREEFINETDFKKEPFENEYMLEYLSCLSIINTKLIVNDVVKQIVIDE